MVLVLFIIYELHIIYPVLHWKFYTFYISSTGIFTNYLLHSLHTRYYIHNYHTIFTDAVITLVLLTHVKLYPVLFWLLEILQITLTYPYSIYYTGITYTYTTYYILHVNCLNCVCGNATVSSTTLVTLLYTNITLDRFTFLLLNTS